MMIVSYNTYLPDPEECEQCGEALDDPNWLPEGQCYCSECAFEYWVEENMEDLTK